MNLTVYRLFIHGTVYSNNAGTYVRHVLYVYHIVQYIPANHVKVSMSVHGPMSAHTEQRNTVLKIYPQPLDILYTLLQNLVNLLLY